jgi:hypothetical protein
MARPLDMVWCIHLDLKQGSLLYSHEKIPRYGISSLDLKQGSLAYSHDKISRYDV